MNMQPSQTGIDLIKHFEGFKTLAYQDSAAIWTIGYGTIKYPDGIHVRQHDECTQEQAETWLRNDLKEAVRIVNSLIFNQPINQNQFDAMVSFEYNTGGLPNSTLYRKARQKPNDDTIYRYDVEDGKPVPRSCEFLKWCIAAGKVIPGLVTRRAKEADLYCS